MAAPSNVILVPKPARSYFNPNRPVTKNTLLKNQIEQIHKLEQNIPSGRQTGEEFDSIKTEGQASEYIRKMTGLLNPQVAKRGGR